LVEFCFLQSLRLATQATSLYTREAHHHPTVHIKGVTHYTLRGSSVKRSTNKIARTPFDFSADKSALWKVPVGWFFVLTIQIKNYIRFSLLRGTFVNAVIKASDLKSRFQIESARRKVVVLSYRVDAAISL